ncbi:hypothetical protein H8356DRAFT_1322838 [Neocallimastix lanati (nom. inval.)]|nr:hypothetical protein H8356DRAFT_1322838 [Neocallimastix sp. JGI-2020a]
MVIVFSSYQNIFDEFIETHHKLEQLDDSNVTATTTIEIVTSYYHIFLYVQSFSIDLTEPNTGEDHQLYYSKKNYFIFHQLLPLKVSVKWKKKIVHFKSQIYKEWSDGCKLKVVEGRNYRYDTETMARLSEQFKL